MATCIKTGSILRVVTPSLSGQVAEHFKAQANITSNCLYGDTHIVGNVCVIYFPKGQDRQYEKESIHGNLFMLSYEDYFYRMSDPFNILIVPANWVQFKEEALYPLDLEKYREAVEKSFL